MAARRHAAPGHRPTLDARTLSDPIEFETDEHGNVRGGVRTPHVDVPIAVLSGLGNSGAPLAHLCGTTTTFTAEPVAAHYSSRAEYVDRFAAATQRAVSAGHLLPADAPEINALANVALPTPLTNAGRQAAAPRWLHAVGG